MSEDQQTYKRAMNAALVGLAAQVLLTAVMALVGVYAQAPAVNAAALYMLGGVPVWIVLAMLFHLQRQERAEALEAEQLAQADAASAAIFTEAGDQLRFARKRLANLIKYWLNIVSLGVAFYLLAVGGWYLFTASKNPVFLEAIRNIGTTLGTRSTALGISPVITVAVVAIVALVVGFVAFLVARYVAGMTQVKSWQPLRGGAGYMMGNGFVALLIMVAAILRYFDVSLPAFVILAFAIPVVMMLLGVEMLLGFVFGFYRPRKPGDAPKPAFESKLLGWLTRPESIGKIVSETINYQFGFEISSSWFYRLISRWIVWLIVLGGLVLLGLSSFVIVGPHENAVVTRFGSYRGILPPGPHWKLPWPAERAEKFDVSQVQSMDIASSSKEHLEPGTAILWTNEHGGAEKGFYLTPEPVSRDERPNDDASANAVAAGLIGIRVTIQYRIDDLAKYVGVDSAQQPVELFRREAEGVVNRFFATHDIESLLSSVQSVAGDQLKAGLDQPAADLGLKVLAVSLTSLHPPQSDDVAKSFLARIEADITKQATIEDAHKDAVTTLTTVAGSRERALQIVDAIGEAARLQNEVRRTAATDAAALETLNQQLAEKREAIANLIADAGGQAASLIYRARAERWKQSLGEWARVVELRAQYDAYQRSPDYFKAREYFQVLTDALTNRDKPVRKVVLTAPNAADATIRLNLEDQGAGPTSAWSTGN